MPKISIITTTYNHKNFIRYTIESVLSQTFSDWELLIWDDSPNDDTREIVQEYVKKYPNKIKARHHKPNKWIVDNMNFLLSQVSEESEYISFLEGDDMYTLDNLEEKIKIFIQFPDVCLVYNDLQTVDKNNIVQKKSWYENKPPFKNNKLVDRYSFVSNPAGIMSYSSVILKKTILHSIPIRQLRKSSSYATSDWDLFWRIVCSYKSYYINKQLTIYRWHDNNVSKQKWVLPYDISLIAAKRFDEKFREKKIVFYEIVRSFFSSRSLNLFVWKFTLLIIIFSPRKIFQSLFKFIYKIR